MKSLLMQVGDFAFEDSPVNKGLIGGKIIATNSKTGETTSMTYKKFHTGKTNKFDVLAKLMYKLVPPEQPEENNDTDEETSANS